MKLTLFLGVLFVLVSVFNINATTYYVDNIGGNDINSGKTITLAWKTITKVNSFSFKSNDTVLFKSDGRFGGASLNPHHNSVSYGSYGTGAKPIIDGQMLRTSLVFNWSKNEHDSCNFNNLRFANGNSEVIDAPYSRALKFENCVMDSNKVTASGGSVLVGFWGGDGLIIRNCTFSHIQITSDHGEPLYVSGVNNTLIENCTFDGGFAGLRLAFNSETGWGPLSRMKGVIIRNCIVKNQSYDCIDDDGTDGALFENNVFEISPTSGWHNVVHLFTDGSGTYNSYAPINSTYRHNTFINHVASSSPMIQINDGISTTGFIFTRNIFVSTNSNQFIYWGVPAGTMVFTDNYYYRPSNTYNYFWYWGTSALTTAQWKARGNDVNSIFGSDPLINSDYTLAANSPAIGYGAVFSTQTIISAPVCTTATSVSQTGFTANWSSVTGAKSYYLDVSTSSTFSTLVINNSNVGNVTQTTVAGLSASTLYYYRVRTTDNVTTSANSNVISVITLAAPVTPPTGGVAVSTYYYTFSWNVVIGASSYILQASFDSTFNGMIYNQHTTATSVQIPFVSTYKGTCYWRICAVNSLGIQSAWTNYSFIIQ